MIRKYAIVNEEGLVVNSIVLDDANPNGWEPPEGCHLVEGHAGPGGRFIDGYYIPPQPSDLVEEYETE